MIPDDLRVLVAGGGTGGHLFPGVAVAEEFLRRVPGGGILFVGTKRGLESRILGNLGYSLRTVPVSGLRGKGVFGLLGGLMKIPAGLSASREILGEFRPDLVFGVGGYASGPVVFMARLMRIPTAIAEQNAVPGMTNRILGRFADRIFVSFPETMSFFPGEKVFMAGNPVRRGFIETPVEKKDRDRPFTVLISGGSQGAGAINGAFLEAASRLRDLRGEIFLIHQTGPGDYERVLEAYGRAGVEAEVHAFIDDMAAACGRADLLVCRAGATTVAEITARGKAAVFIPFPFAAGDHQRKNAELLVRKGAGEMILQKDLKGEKIIELIRFLARNRDRVVAMGEEARKLGNVHAARDIVASCLDLLEEAQAVKKGQKV